jgi:DNA transformation protein
MGERGDRVGGDTASVAETVAKRLAPLGDVETKKMFGGCGVFEDGVMFAMVDSRGRVFFRGTREEAEALEAAGAEPHGKMPYWTAPPDVDADDHRYRQWATDALDRARAAKK